ncbi:hypothetical protein DFH27DRAFT_617293 [Peziza echinospora]|nr:hypothetical protein DFH27DRAFT_617293 [Peziza echinospora]
MPGILSRPLHLLQQQKQHNNNKKQRPQQHRQQQQPAQHNNRLDSAMDESNTPPSFAATPPTGQEETHPSPITGNLSTDTAEFGTMCIDAPCKNYLNEHNISTTGAKVNVTRKWLCKTLRINDTEWLTLCNIINTHLLPLDCASDSLQSIASKIHFWAKAVKQVALGLLQQAGGSTAPHETIVRWKALVLYGWGDRVNLDDSSHNGQHVDRDEDTALKVLAGLLYSARPHRCEYPQPLSGWHLWATVCLVRRAEGRTFGARFRSVLAQEGALRNDPLGHLSRQYMLAAGAVTRRNAEGYTRGLVEFVNFNTDLQYNSRHN